jgi:eukaryotic-like serine/threonine-protein kinase
MHILFEPSGALLTNGPDGVRRWPVRVGPAPAELVHVGPPEKLPLPGSDCNLARSMNGRVLASSQHQGALVLHQDFPGQPIRLGPHVDDDVRYVAVSPDGRLVATASHSGARVKIWQLESGKLERAKLVKELPVRTILVGFSPDAKWLATSNGDCRLWAVDSWQPGPHIGKGTYFAFSPVGKLLAVETGHGVVRLVNPETGREFARLEDPNHHPDRAGEMRFSPDGTKLVTTGNNNQSVHVWDLRAIREHLAMMDLDWALPSYPPAKAKNDRPPLQVTVDLGALVPETPNEAVLKYSLALAFMPLNPEAYLGRGRTYFQLQQWREAADDFGMALALCPGNNQEEVWFQLGYASAASGRSKQALAAYSRSLELNPKNPAAWNNRASVYNGLAQWDKAISDFSQVVKLAPNQWQPLYGRGLAYAGLSQWDKAIADYSQAIKLKPDLWAAYESRRSVYATLGQWEKIIGEYSTTIELTPDHAGVHNSLGWLLATCPDHKFRDSSRAVELGTEAVRRAPKDGNCWITLGVAQYRAGNWKPARESLEKAMPLRNGGNCTDWFFLAMVHWKLGDKTQARQWYDKANLWMASHHHPDWPSLRTEAAELVKKESEVEKQESPKK